VDFAAVDAGDGLIGLLGEHNARTLLRVLELPDDDRFEFISRMY